jgi:SAM-dependent methyltransferase
MSGIETGSVGWRAVDNDSGEATRYLELAARVLDVMKRKSIDSLRLQLGAAVLDIGCGLGRDAERMLGAVGPAGRVVGIDASQDLIRQAIERTQATAPRPEFRLGNALALDFDDNTFDACRIDRVLMHLEEPAPAVTEMTRVTRPGGRVSVLDSDWYTLIIAGGDVAVAQAVSRQVACVSIRQGDIGRRLVELMMDAGCDDVDVDAEPLVLRDLGTANDMMYIRRMLEAAIMGGAIARDTGEAWWEAVRELDARGRFFASVTSMICTGTVR